MTRAGGGSADEVIGRAAELAAIDRLLARSQQGLSGLILEGEPGIGKSTLWRAALATAADEGFQVLISRPAPAEQGLTFGGLDDLFSEVSPEAMSRLPEPQRHALEVALLRVEPDGGTVDQRAVSRATASLLEALTQEGAPLLVAIDDLQWLDAATAAVLSFAIRRLEKRPIALVLSLRGKSTTPLPLDLDAALPAEHLELIPLTPLPLAALHVLLRSRVQRSFTRIELVRIEQMSGGNPFYALEIARALDRSGAAINPGDRLPVPETLANLMSLRVGAFPEHTKEALRFMAAAFDPTLGVLREAVDFDAAAALKPALEDGIVVLEGDTVRFTHPMLAESVLALADPPALRAVNARLAELAMSEDAAARHLGLAAAGPDEDVAMALESAASRARLRGATLDGVSLYERASALTPAAFPERATARATLAAECLFLDISEMVQADSILEGAIQRARPGPSRANPLSLRAIVRYYHGRLDEAIRLAEQALDEAGDDAVMRARVLVRLAFVVGQVDAARSTELAADAVDLIDHRDAVDPDLLAVALLLRASGDMGLVKGIRWHDIRRAEQLISVDGRSWERENADGLAFGFARHTDDLDRAIAMTVRLIADKSGPGGDDPFNLVQLAGLHCLRGEWAEARRLAEAAVEGYTREGADLFPAWGLRGVAMVAAHQGRIDDARALASKGLELAIESGNLAVAVMHQQILGFVALSLGEFREADRWLSEAAATARRTGTLHPCRYKLEGDRIDAALAIGALESAEQMVNELEHAERAAATPWTLAIGARCRGQLEAARGDLEAADVALQRAVTEHEHLPMPFDLARTLLVKGQVHRRRKEKRLADTTLREALRLFESLGAPLWADKTRVELGRIGLRPRAPTELTDTERRVAELAAQGLSTREIAKVAFLAPKTVGNVLGRVYEKLGISSRAQLGALMTGGRLAGAGTEVEHR